jgi:hypothetical protein
VILAIQTPPTMSRASPVARQASPAGVATRKVSAAGSSEPTRARKIYGAFSRTPAE